MLKENCYILCLVSNEVTPCSNKRNVLRRQCSDTNRNIKRLVPTSNVSSESPQTSHSATAAVQQPPSNLLLLLYVVLTILYFVKTLHLCMIFHFFNCSTFFRISRGTILVTWVVSPSVTCFITVDLWWT